MAAGQLLDRALWTGMPRLVAKFSGLTGAILADGQYLRRKQGLGVALSLLLLALGLLIGGFHPALLGFDDPRRAYTFSASLVFVAMVLAAGCFSAQLGFMIWAGYVLGDLVLFQRPSDPVNAIGFYLGLSVSYFLLLQLGCLVPLISRNLALASTGALAKALEPRALPGAALRLAAGSGFLALFLISWIAAFPFLIRPAYTFAGRWNGGWFDPVDPDAGAVEPVQGAFLQGLTLAHPLILIGLAAFAARLLLEAFWRRDAAVQEPEIEGPAWPLLLAIPIKAAFLTLLLSGLLASLVEAALLWTALVGLLIGTALIQKRFDRWYAAVSAVPLLLRLIGGFAAVYWLSATILQWVERHYRSQALLPVLLCGILGALIFCLLIPPARRRRPVERDSP